MSLELWVKNGWLRAHKTSSQEIKNLLEIVERDLTDASAKTLSVDWSFGIAYNAALKLCTVLLYSSGFRPEKNLAHFRTLQALPLILGVKYNQDADYLDLCRKKRNETEYDFIGGVSQSEADELISFAKELRGAVIQWLTETKKYPQ